MPNPGSRPRRTAGKYLFIDLHAPSVGKDCNFAGGVPHIGDHSVNDFIKFHKTSFQMRRRTSPAAAELVCPLFPDILPWLLCQDPLFNISSLFPHSNSLHFFFHVTQVDGHLHWSISKPRCGCASRVNPVSSPAIGKPGYASYPSCARNCQKRGASPCA